MEKKRKRRNREKRIRSTIFDEVVRGDTGPPLGKFSSKDTEDPGSPSTHPTTCAQTAVVETSRDERGNLPRREDYVYTDVLPNGEVVEMKMVSGVSVIVRRLGKMKDWTKKALERMVTLRPNEVRYLDVGELTHLELAMLGLSTRAAKGCLESTKEVLDRVLGKAKQVTENTNISMTLDDVLKQAGITVPEDTKPEEGEVIDV